MIATDFHILALQADQLVKEYNEGKLTADEYKELVENMRMLEAISQDTANLEENIVYRNMIVTAINIATSLA